MIKSHSHYIICRREQGWGTGPLRGVQGHEEIQVMAASRTLAGARRLQRRFGGSWIERRNRPLRMYRPDECIR